MLYYCMVALSKEVQALSKAHSKNPAKLNLKKYNIQVIFKNDKTE